MSTIGFVKKLNTKSGTGRNGKPYTLYSMKLADKDGNELPGWFQCGFEKPPCKEGDYIKLSANPNGNNFDVVKGSIQVSKNSPAAPASVAPSAPQSGGAGGGGQTQKNIHYQNSRTAAIELVGLLIENDAIALPAAKNKASASSRFDIITAAVDKLTVRFFNDLESFRLFDTVADAGEAAAEVEEELPDADEFDDEIPFGNEEDDDGFE